MSCIPRLRKDHAMKARHATFTMALVSALAALAFAQGCSKASACVTRGADVTITGQHEHAATISIDHVKRGVGGTYVAKGKDHDHLFMLKDVDMASLQKGETVKTVTSSTNAHVHEVVVACKAD